jgi:hypothetical protein
VRKAAICLLSIGLFVVLPPAWAQTTAPTPEENPEGNTGALKAQVTTGGSYDAHSGNATRVVTDLRVPGGLGVEGLAFTRYWNSLPNDYKNPFAVFPSSFGTSSWSHSFQWYANEEDTSEMIDPKNDSSEEIYTTAITVTFPDGHATRYKISRSSRGHDDGNGNVISVGAYSGPPYSSYEQNGFRTSGRIYDTLSDMAPDGSQFWIYRADGSSVHFVGGGGGYQVNEMFDPHGLRTELQYDASDRLIKVLQDGGRFLTIHRSTYGYFGDLIDWVESGGGGGGVQRVSYSYAQPQGLPNWLTLSEVHYPEGATANYTYELYYGGDPALGSSDYPLLKYADDPRYAGAMTKIRYAYRGSACPANAPGTFNPDYFEARPEAIASENSGETGVAVSRFSINCYDGTRMENSGLSSWRMFTFGTYHLIKLTDFTNQYPFPAGLPFEEQTWAGGQPHQIWDGRRLETDAVVYPFNFATGQFGDSSGEPSEIHHTSADGTYQIFDRVHPGASEPQDYSKVPNRYNHWLFSHRDERGEVTTYTRDYRRRVKRIDYPGGSYETFVYDNGVHDGFNQVTQHHLASGADEYFNFDGRGLLQWEYQSL